MKTIRHALLVTFALFLGLAATSRAQLGPPPDDLTPISVEDIPETVCNYDSMQPWRPPLPFNWLAEETNIVLYVSPSRGTNVIWVGDQDIDYAQRAAEDEVLALAAEAAAGNASMQRRIYQPTEYTYLTDDLYLELLVSTNASAEIVIHTPETDGVYDLFFGVSLPTTNTWMWAMRTEAGQTNITLTNLLSDQTYFILGRTNDTDADGISDACEKLVTGTDPQTADATAISFSLSLPYDYVNNRMVTGAVTVLSGFPTLMTVLIDPTNFDGAVWVPLTSTVTVDLGSADGRKEVWVGLSGPVPNIEPAWQATHVTLATAAPVLIITNPISLTDSRPMIQLQGYSATPLASLFYDVTNDAGASVINGQGFVVDEYYDTNTFAFTTNFFQCFDIPLALGSNTIILRATDRAGNTALTNLSYTFSTNADTTAPVITLAWPQDGMNPG